VTGILLFYNTLIIRFIIKFTSTGGREHAKGLNIHFRNKQDLSIYSCWSHLEHMAFLKRFVSLQFLTLDSRWDSLDGGSARRKAATYTTQNKRKYQCLEWDSNPRSQCLSGRRHFMP
jgi:hypothetical protein